MKLDNYIKEYKHKGLVSRNPGLYKIGFCAWRPKIILLELEKMQDGDILIYRDCNILKYPILGNYNNIKNKAIEILEKINFDFFIPRANKVFTPLKLSDEQLPTQKISKFRYFNLV